MGAAIFCGMQRMKARKKVPNGKRAKDQLVKSPTSESTTPGSGAQSDSNNNRQSDSVSFSDRAAE